LPIVRPPVTSLEPMNSHGSVTRRSASKLEFCSAPSILSVRAVNVRCQCSQRPNERADNDTTWKDVHMPALRQRLEALRQRGAEGRSYAFDEESGRFVGRCATTYCSVELCHLGPISITEEALTSEPCVLPVHGVCRRAASLMRSTTYFPLL
jgi:hypothetical protein